MTAVFLDTSGLIALVDESDYWHLTAKSVWSEVIQQKRPLVTTSAILVELADGLSKARFRQTAIRVIESLKASKNVVVIDVTPNLAEDAWRLFKARPDKDWGMTDCISFTQMNFLGLNDVFGLDNHFEQAGFVLLITEN